MGSVAMHFIGIVGSLRTMSGKVIKLSFIFLLLLQFTNTTYNNCKIKKSYSRISHDCVAEPECEEKCRTIQRNTCDIVEETECVTNNERQCETTDEEVCQTVTEEECSQTLSQQCQTVEEEGCSTVSNDECRTVTDRVCDTVMEQDCRTAYEDKCTTVNERECSTVQEQQCSTVNEQMCMTENQQVCETVNDQMCTASEVCDSVPEQECSTTYSQQCYPSSGSRRQDSDVSYNSRSRSTSSQTFSASINDIKNVPRVVSVTSFRNGQNRDPTQSRSIINKNSGSVNIPGVGSFDVGSSESELKDTFLTTGIFQRKPGDSLDGRRSTKGSRFKRQAQDQEENSKIILDGNIKDIKFTLTVSKVSTENKASNRRLSSQRNATRRSDSQAGLARTPRTVTQVLPGSIKDLLSVSKVVSRTTYGGNSGGQVEYPANFKSISSIGSNNRSISSLDVEPTSISEDELKETFLTTGIFQKKEGDSLDGRRSLKGQRIKRQARYGRSNSGYNNNYNAEPQQQQQSCQSVPSQQCRNVPRKKCSTNMHQNCQNVPRQVCRSVPRQICMTVPRQSCQNVPRESCQNVPRTSCQSVPSQKCRDVPREVCRNVDREECNSSPTEQCKKVPRQRCSSKPQRQCKSAPRKSCRTQPRESCITIPKQQCSTTPRKVCKNIPERKCKETCKNVYWCKICNSNRYGY